MKKLLSMVLAVVMLISLMAVVPAAGADDGFKATLGYATSDWSVSEWGDNVNTTVTGAGTYTLSWDLPEGTAITDALVFVVDIVGAGSEGYALTDLSVTADGEEIAVDMAKVATGDLEEKGNFRIEIYNEYGPTKEDAPIDTALAASGNLTVTFTIAAEGAAELAPHETKLGFANSDWSVQEWGDNAAITVEGAGEYTLSWDLPEGTTVSDALVFVVDVVGGGKDGFVLADLTITADDVDVPVDLAKVVTGDVEENGNFRIEIYNEYGTTKSDAPIDNAISITKNLTIAFTLEIDPNAAPAAKKEAKAAEPFDPSGSYNAYLGVQTPNWTYRDPWNSANGIGSEHWGDFIFGNETNEKYGVVTDAVVAGNGTYTVSVTDFGTIFADDFKTAGQEWFNLLFISTDIPMDENVKVTDVKLIIDGKTVHKYAEAYLDPDTTDYVKILIQNIWNEDVKEISYYAAPTTSLEMTFTISGFDYDA